VPDHVIKEDVIPLIATAHHVAHASGQFNPNGTCIIAVWRLHPPKATPATDFSTVTPTTTKILKGAEAASNMGSPTMINLIDQKYMVWHPALDPALDVRNSGRTHSSSKLSAAMLLKARKASWSEGMDCAVPAIVDWLKRNYRAT
jgi:hypothetical protein